MVQLEVYTDGLGDLEALTSKNGTLVQLMERGRWAGLTWRSAFVWSAAKISQQTKHQGRRAAPCVARRAVESLHSGR